MSDNTTIPIPGGSATFYSVDDITPRRRRPLEILFVQMGDLQDRIKAAASVTVVDEKDGTTATVLAPATPGQMPKLGVTLNAHEAELMVEVGQTAAWAFLKSWTLTAPLPATPDDMLDLPSTALYDALVEHGSKLYTGTIGDGFDLGSPGFEAETSPTVASNA